MGVYISVISNTIIDSVIDKIAVPAYTLEGKHS